MQADLEQQHDDADFRQRVDDGIGGLQDAERRPAEQHAGDELAEHRGLTDALRRLAEQSRRENDRDEDGEEVGEGGGHAGGVEWSGRGYEL